MTHSVLQTKSTSCQFKMKVCVDHTILWYRLEQKDFNFKKLFSNSHLDHLKIQFNVGVYRIVHDNEDINDDRQIISSQNNHLRKKRKTSSTNE